MWTPAAMAGTAQGVLNVLQRSDDMMGAAAAAAEQTRQTISTRGTIDRLLENDTRRRREGREAVIRPRHLRAMLEIETVYRSAVRSAMPGVVRYGEGPSAFIAHPHIHEAYRDRYRPWAERLAASRAQNGPPILQTVIDIVIDGRTATDLDRAHHHRRGTCVRWLVYGLDLYGQIAGWM